MMSCSTSENDLRGGISDTVTYPVGRYDDYIVRSMVENNMLVKQVNNNELRWQKLELHQPLPSIHNTYTNQSQETDLLKVRYISPVLIH